MSDEVEPLSDAESARLDVMLALVNDNPDAKVTMTARHLCAFVSEKTKELEAEVERLRLEILTAMESGANAAAEGWEKERDALQKEANLLRAALQHELSGRVPDADKNTEWNVGYRARQVEEWSIGTYRRKCDALEAEVERLRGELMGALGSAAGREDEIEDIRGWLEGLPDSLLATREGLAAATMRSLRAAEAALAKHEAVVEAARAWKRRRDLHQSYWAEADALDAALDDTEEK